MIGKLLDTLVGGAIRNIPGGIGQRIRGLYWRWRLRACGRIKIDEGVIFQYPERIEIGDNVWIFPYAILTGPAPGVVHEEDDEQNGHLTGDPLLLRIGDEVQIGAYSLLNGTGGLYIGNYVTISARVSIYSSTHLPRNPDDPSMSVGCNGMVRRLPVYSHAAPLTISDGAWLGLHAMVVCADIGEQAFVSSGALLTEALPAGKQLRNDGSIRDRYFEG